MILVDANLLLYAANHAAPEHPRARVWLRIFGAFLKQPWMTSRLVPDAHLAALAIEHGLTLCSADGDFAKFSGLTWVNPMAADR